MRFKKERSQGAVHKKEMKVYNLTALPLRYKLSIIQPSLESFFKNRKPINAHKINEKMMKK